MLQGRLCLPGVDGEGHDWEFGTRRRRTPSFGVPLTADIGVVGGAE